MSLSELHAIQRWHWGHRRQRVEAMAWDAVVMLWVLGWVGAPLALLLHSRPWLVGSLALVPLPGLYVSIRRRLHRTGRLRCDWIAALR